MGPREWFQMCRIDFSGARCSPFKEEFGWTDPASALFFKLFIDSCLEFRMYKGTHQS